MRTITLFISDIHKCTHDDDAVDVVCTHTGYINTCLVGRSFRVRVTASDVCVTELVGDGRQLRKPGDVLVSTELVDATRRLFGLVGDA